MVPIDKGIPIPPPATRNGPVGYPWRELEIGDSFLYNATKTSAQSLASTMGKLLDRRFMVRQTGNEVRIWRVEPRSTFMLDQAP